MSLISNFDSYSAPNYYNDVENLEFIKIFESADLSKYSENDFKISEENFLIKKNKDDLLNKTIFSHQSKSEENIFIKRTFFEKEQLIKIKNMLESISSFEYSHDLNTNERMKIKRMRAKFLLKKTRRESTNIEGELNEDYEKFCNKEKNKNSLSCDNKQDLKNKKDLLMKRNRESAQLSRFNKKLSLEQLKQKENFLLEENKNLKNMIGKMNTNACGECKKTFEEINNTSNTIEKDVNKKIKFKIITSNSLTNSNFISNSNKYSFYTGVLVILCLLGNLMNNININQQSSLTKDISPRILVSLSKNYTVAYKQPKNMNLPNNQTINGKSEIFNRELNKSFYLKFIDYLKISTGYSVSDHIDIYNKSNSNPVKYNFLSESPKNSEDLNKKSCLRKEYFDLFFMNKKNLNDNNNPPYSQSTCNITKFTGYFGIDYAKNELHKDKNNLKMIIPIEKETFPKNEKIKTFIVDYMTNNNFSKINDQEKKSKLIYFEIDCKVLDINRYLSIK